MGMPASGPEIIMQTLSRVFALLVVAALVSLPVMAASDGVKQVNPKSICFLHKTRFPHPLKSVEVDGKKYYGSSKDCLAKLKDDPSARMDVDPVSGKPVDKAAAVIGVDKAGKIYFFENQENMKKFRVPAASAVPTGL
jgi:YHS domain-containing protein